MKKLACSVEKYPPPETNGAQSQVLVIYEDPEKAEKEVTFKVSPRSKKRRSQDQCEGLSRKRVVSHSLTDEDLDEIVTMQEDQQVEDGQSHARFEMAFIDRIRHHSNSSSGSDTSGKTPEVPVETRDEKCFRMTYNSLVCVAIFLIYSTFGAIHPMMDLDIRKLSTILSNDQMKWVSNSFTGMKFAMLLITTLCCPDMPHPSRNMKIFALFAGFNYLLHSCLRMNAMFINPPMTLILFFLFSVTIVIPAFALAYIARATLPDERGSFLGLALGSACLGYLSGLGVQAATSSLDNTLATFAPMNAYTATDYYCILLCGLTLLVLRFVDYCSVNDIERQLMHVRTISGTHTSYEARYHPLASMLVLFSITTLQLYPPVIHTFTWKATMDLHVWKWEIGVFRIGIIPVSALAIAGLVFPFAGHFLRKIRHLYKALMISMTVALCAIVMMVLHGTKLADAPSVDDDARPLLRCSHEEDWCNWYRYIPMPFLLIYTVLLTVAYAFGLVSCFIILSKGLGPIYQAKPMMAVLLCDCLADICHPIFVTTLYKAGGPTRVLIPLVFCTCLIVICCLWYSTWMIPNWDIAQEYNRNLRVSRRSAVNLCYRYHCILLGLDTRYVPPRIRNGPFSTRLRFSLIGIAHRR